MATLKTQETVGSSRNAGFFLNQDCEVLRKTYTIQRSMGIEAGKRLVVPAGTVYPSNDECAIGLLYEDIDVTKGDEDGSVVLVGTVDSEKVNVSPEAVAAMKASGMIFVQSGADGKKRVEFTLKGPDLTNEIVQMIDDEDEVYFVVKNVVVSFEEYTGDAATNSGEIIVPQRMEWANDKQRRYYFLYVMTSGQPLTDFSPEGYTAFLENNLGLYQKNEAHDAPENPIGYYYGGPSSAEPTIPYEGEYTPSKTSVKVEECNIGKLKAIFEE